MNFIFYIIFMVLGVYYFPKQNQCTPFEVGILMFTFATQALIIAYGTEKRK